MFPFTLLTENLPSLSKGNDFVSVIPPPLVSAVSAVPSVNSISPCCGCSTRVRPPGGMSRTLLRPARATNITATTTKTNRLIPRAAMIQPRGERFLGGAYGGTVDGYGGGTDGW